MILGHHETVSTISTVQFINLVYYYTIKIKETHSSFHRATSFTTTYTLINYLNLLHVSYYYFYNIIW